MVVLDCGKISRSCSQRLRLDFARCLSLLFVAVVTAASSQETLAGTLVEDGRSTGCIVLPEGIDESERRLWKAANDLAGYIQQMSGARMPLRWDNEHCAGFRILIGSTRLATVKLDDVSEKRVGFDGFIIRSVSNGVVITGRTPHGTGNGVYYFAEEVLGVRWHSLRQDAPTVPKRRTISIAELDITEKPVFGNRMHGGPIWMNHITDQMKANWGNWARFNRLGGRSSSFGHVFFRIVPDSLFEAHPEYFPLIDGRRRNDLSELQRCYSNPDVLQLAIEFTRRWFDKYPGSCTSLSQNDGEGWCECEPCLAMGPTKAHQILTFANRVASANENLYPTGQYGVLAYASSFDAPADMTGHKNVIPVICNYAATRTPQGVPGICRTHSIHSNCPSSVYKRDTIKQWVRICGRFGTYGYGCNGPFSTPSLLSLAEELKFYRDLGGTVIRYHEQTGAPKSGWEMAFWAETKLMWDVDLDPATLRRQFIEGHYGKVCADAVEKVFIAVERGVRGLPTAADWQSDLKFRHNQLPRSTMQPILDANRGDILTALKLSEHEPNEFFRDNVNRDMRILIEDLDWKNFPKRQ